MIVGTERACIGLVPWIDVYYLSSCLVKDWTGCLFTFVQFLNELLHVFHSYTLDGIVGMLLPPQALRINPDKKGMAT